MSTSPAQVRAAAAAFVSAVERHLSAVEHRTGEVDPVVQQAFSGLAEAFLVYEDALLDAYDEVTPFELPEEDDEDDDDLEDDEDDDDLEDDDLEDDEVEDERPAPGTLR